MHTALEAWLCMEVRGDHPVLLDLGRREASRLIEEDSPPGVRRALSRAVAAETERILLGFLDSPLPSRLAAAEILGTEVPILFRDRNGQTWTGACDLLFREGGSVVVADFKTDQVDRGATVIAERYRAQIGVYLEAVGRALGEAGLRGEVLFVRTGEAVVLLPAPPDPD